MPIIGACERWAERTENGLSGSGAVNGQWAGAEPEREAAERERRAGVTEICLSAERQVGRSRSAHVVCPQERYKLHIFCLFGMAISVCFWSGAKLFRESANAGLYVDIYVWRRLTALKHWSKHPVCQTSNTAQLCHTSDTTVPVWLFCAGSRK